MQRGVEFGDLFPELVKTSSPLAVATGVIAKTSDMWRAIQLFNEDRTVFVDRIPDKDIADVIAGRSLTIPTLAKPVFYEERDNIYVLPTTFSDDMYVRYVINHPDVAVITSNNGYGKYSNSPGTYTSATKTFAVAVGEIYQNGIVSGFVAADTGKMVVVLDATPKIYFGRIASVTDAVTVVLQGDGLPTADIAGTANIYMIDVEDLTDILLKEIWDTEIQDRMVKLAITDARENIQS